MKTIIFLGPSLPIDEATSILPDAVYLPPVSQAGLMSAVTTYRPDVVGMIDGVFGQCLSVWHKEILYALSQGILVFGASSMGALRAAETADFGMVGVGEIFQMYREGELTDDDEVALIHGDAATGYRNHSIPMVNIRATFRKALDEGVMDTEQVEILTSIAKDLYFPERTFGNILKLAEQKGFDKEKLCVLERYVSRHYVDLKKEDAALLLETIRALNGPLPKPDRGFRMSPSHLFDTLYNRDRTVRHLDTDIPLSAIANHAALHLSDIAGLNFHALNRQLVLIFADTLDIQVTAGEVEKEIRRFILRHRMGSSEKLNEWIQRNDLTQDEFSSLMTEVARCRKLQLWLITRKHLERTAKIILDELRLENRYEEAARQTAEKEKILQEDYSDYKEISHQNIPLPELVVDHLRETTWRIDTHFSEWYEEGGFHSLDDFRIELQRSRMARKEIESIKEQVSAILNGKPDEHKRKK